MNGRRYHYEPGSVRHFRWPPGAGDVRGYRPPPGWSAMADLTDTHPLTGKTLPQSQWWITETKEQDQ